MRTTTAAIALGAALLGASPGSARAEGDSDQALFDGAVVALGRGAVDDAIDRLELLADRGFVHPDASYDRALAYARRARSPAARPGDLGRAAAGFGEALMLRPDDADAEAAQDAVRREIAKRRARAGVHQMDRAPSLTSAIVGLVDEDTWAVLAAAAAVLLSVGLAARLFARSARAHLAGVVCAGVGAVALALTGGLTAGARVERRDHRSAVVIVEEARLLDKNGVPLSGPGSLVPEGASVRIAAQHGTLAHAEWGTLDGWLSLGQLRILAQP